MSSPWQLQAPSDFILSLFQRETKRRTSLLHSRVVPHRENPRRTPANFFLIPPELVDAILNYCDSKALHASSLVCKSWRTLTMHRLFSKVELLPARSHEFVEFLKSESGVPIRGSVQCLAIDTGSASVHKSLIADVKSLSTLLRLISLKLSIYGSTGYIDLSIFPRNFKTIIILELTLYFDTFIEVAELISSFPSLETLTLNGGTGGEQIEQELPGHHIYLPRMVHTIHLLAMCPTSTLLRWLCSHERTPLISTLTLNRKSTFEATTNAFLQKLGGTLRRLTITGLIRHSSPPGPLDLSCNTGLRTLTIHNWRRSSEIAFGILSQVTSLSMEEIEFAAPTLMSSPDDDRYWPLLDALLARPQFSGLQRITVKVIPDTAHEVEARLPMIWSRGLLRFYTMQD